MIHNYADNTGFEVNEVHEIRTRHATLDAILDTCFRELIDTTVPDVQVIHAQVVTGLKILEKSDRRAYDFYNTVYITILDSLLKKSLDNGGKKNE